LVSRPSKTKQERKTRVQVKTILNHVQKFKSFVYGKSKWKEESDGKKSLYVEVYARQNSRPICSECGNPGPGYDTLKLRTFEFVPLWGIAVYFLYAMRRVDCQSCGVTVESVPWSEGKQTLTRAYMQFLAGWAKRVSWKEVAAVFHTSWEKVFQSVEWIVAWGLAHRNLSGVEAIGVDEILWHRGHKFLTVVYQIDSHCKRLLWIGLDRRVETLEGFFHQFGEPFAAGLKFICSDMWKMYMKVIAQKAPWAIHVLDRFHIAAHMNKAIDHVRAEEARNLKAKGKEPILKGSRWCLLKRPENLTEKQDIKLKDLVCFNLKAVRSYLLKEDFQFFWTYTSPHWAGKFIDAWCRRTMLSQIEPMKKVARMLRYHRELMLNWFRAKGQISSAAVEGFNNKAKLTTRKAYGFRTFKATQAALYHTLGSLPEPETTHKFC
jgi:transposase